MRPGDDHSLLTGCNRAGLVITRVQLEAWAGRPLSPDDLARLCDALPESSVPQAIGQIVDGFTNR